MLFQHVSFQKHSKEKALWLTGVVYTWRSLYLKRVPAKYTQVNVRCRWLMDPKVRFLFWCLQMDFVVPYELWLSQTIRGAIEQSFLSKHTDGYLNDRVKKSLKQKHTCYLSEGTQTGKGLLVDKSMDLRRMATCVPWTGNPAWSGFGKFWLYSTLWEFANTRLQT